MNELKMKIECSSNEIDDFVLDSDMGTIFHTSLWLGDISYIVIYLSDNPVCVMPLPFLNQSNRKPLLTPYSGPVYKKGYESFYSGQNTIPLSIIKGLESLGYDSVINFSPWCGCLNQWICKGYTACLIYTAVLDISDRERLFSKFHTSLKRNISSAERDGYYLEVNGDTDFLLRMVEETFYQKEQDIWFDTETTIGSFSRLYKAGKSCVFSVCNEYGHKLSSIGIVWDHYRCYYILGGRNRIYNDYRAMSFNIWSAMCYIKDNKNVNVFDLEGSNILSISDFFNKFSPNWLPYYCLRKLDLNQFEVLEKWQN